MDSEAPVTPPIATQERPDNSDGEKQPVAGPSGTSDRRDDPSGQIAILEGRLQHYKAWVAVLHSKVHAMNPGAIKNAKKIYVGNLPLDANEDELRDFLNDALEKIGALNGPGLPVVSCKIVQDKNYAFAELRSVEEATNCLSLDGAIFKEISLKIRRPSNYDLATAIMLGPVQPDPTLDLSRVAISKPAPEESPNKLFVGGLPCDWPEEHVRGLLSPFGAIRNFNLVMDKNTGYSKGYAFCEFEDESVNDEVIKSLNQHQVGGRVLTVKRAAEGVMTGGAGGSGVGFSGGSSGGMSRSSSASMFPQTGGGMGGNGGSASQLMGFNPPPPPPQGAVMGPGGMMMGHPYSHPLPPQGVQPYAHPHLMMSPGYHPHAMQFGMQVGSPPGRGAGMDPQAAHFHHYNQQMNQGHYSGQQQQQGVGRVSANSSSGNLVAAHNRPGFGSSGSLNGNVWNMSG